MSKQDAVAWQLIGLQAKPETCLFVALKAVFMRLTTIRSGSRVDFKTSNHTQSRFWLWLTATVVLNCGCGDAPEQAVQPRADRASQAPVSDTTAGSNASGGLGESLSAPFSHGGENPAGSAEVVTEDVSEAIGSAREPQGGKTASASSGNSADASPKVVRQNPEPGPEQLARWARADFEPLQLLACRESSVAGFVSHLAHPLDGRHFITAGTNVTLWSVETDVPEHVFLELTDEQTIKSLAVSPDGKWFAAGDSEGTLRVWDIADRQELNSKKLYSTGIIQIAISPDSLQIATISYDGEIAIWSVDPLQNTNRFKVDTNGLERIEYMTPQLLAAAGETTSCWDVLTGKMEKMLPGGSYNFTMARSPDGSRFVTGGEGALQFWNAADAEPASRLAGSFSTEEFIAFSSNGELLATANGSSVRIWNITGSELGQIIDASGWRITGLSWLPDTNLLVVASENGRTRIWGTTKDGAAMEMQPMHSVVAMPDRKSQEPASPVQMLQMMDLRIFPQLPEGERDGSSIDEFNVRYDAAVTADEAGLFYRYQLGKAGWEEVASAVATANSIRFQKDSFMIAASFYEGAESKTSISVNFAGNYDVRWAPKFDAAPIEVVFENEDTVMYRTKADLIQLETTLLRKMHDAGWTAYARLHASHNEQEDGRDLEFLQGGAILRVTIGRVPADPASYNVQYSRDLTTRSIPVPADSGFVEFDGMTEPFLVATTAMTLERTREFYDTELAAEGWLARDSGRIIKDDHNWLVYVRGQQDLTIGLQSLPTGRTLVRVGDELENSSWQLAKPKAPDAADMPAVGIEAADFPILNESKIAKFDAIDAGIEFSMGDLPLLEVGERYTKELQGLSWQLDGPGVKSDEYVFLTFVKDKVELELRVRTTDDKSNVSVRGDGLLWTKELPSGKKVISYETWLRINHHPAGLDLLDQYQTDMRLIADGRPKAEQPE